MPDVWHPVIQLNGTAKHNEDPLEGAEEFREAVGDNQRVVAVETGDCEVYVERCFGDGSGGWVEIGTEANPNEDYAETMIDMVEGWEREDVRLVFDYTNEKFILEQWVEPE